MTRSQRRSRHRAIAALCSIPESTRRSWARCTVSPVCRIVYGLSVWRSASHLQPQGPECSPSSCFSRVYSCIRSSGFVNCYLGLLAYRETRCVRDQVAVFSPVGRARAPHEQRPRTQRDAASLPYSDAAHRRCGRPLLAAPLCERPPPPRAHPHPHHRSPRAQPVVPTQIWPSARLSRCARSSSPPPRPPGRAPRSTRTTRTSRAASAGAPRRRPARTAPTARARAAAGASRAERRVRWCLRWARPPARRRAPPRRPTTPPLRTARTSARPSSRRATATSVRAAAAPQTPQPPSTARTHRYSYSSLAVRYCVRGACGPQASARRAASAGAPPPSRTTRPSPSARSGARPTFSRTTARAASAKAAASAAGARSAPRASRATSTTRWAAGPAPPRPNPARYPLPASLSPLLLRRRLFSPRGVRALLRRALRHAALRAVQVQAVRLLPRGQ